MKSLILTASLWGWTVLLGAPSTFGQAPVCQVDENAKAREATIRAFMAAVASRDAEKTRALMADPEGYAGNVLEPHNYRGFFPGEVVVRADHRFRVIRLCTYGGHGDEFMTDAEFTDEATVHLADRRGLSARPRRFYVFYHFHYTPDVAEGLLRMGSPFLKSMD